MGNNESTTFQEKYFGFRVYKIVENGPLFLTGVKELEDFIIPPQEIYDNKIPFYQYIRNNNGKKLNFSVYSITKRDFYNIEITPNTTWSKDMENTEQGFLGATVRYENWSTAHKNTLRVVKIKENSQAKDKLNLIPMEDYIIALRPEGKDIISLNTVTAKHEQHFSLFTQILNENLNTNIEFFIYNKKTGKRSVTIFLEDNPDGILGCDVAYGKIHEFPISKDDEDKINNTCGSLNFGVTPIKNEIQSCPEGNITGNFINLTNNSGGISSPEKEPNSCHTSDGFNNSNDDDVLLTKPTINDKNKIKLNL